MKIKFGIFLQLILLVTYGCGGPSVKAQINEKIKVGECRNAEELISNNYSGQDQLYEKAMLYIKCDKNKRRGTLILRKLSEGDHLPSLERLIEFDLADKKHQLRYRELKNQQALARAQRNKEISNQFKKLGCSRAFGGLGCSTGKSVRTEKPKGNLNRLIRKSTTNDGRTLCIYSDGSARNIGYTAVCPLDN